MSTTARDELVARPFTERLWDVFKHTWDLGFTSFGGPPTHFQIFHSRFVEKYKWLDEQMYQEIFALSQSLPGPASTKMGYTIALLHAGFLPALLQFLLWSIPGACGMFGFSIGVSNISSNLPSVVYALLSGLNSATVGIIAVAAMQLSERAIKGDALIRAIVAFTAGAGMLYRALWWFPLLMAITGIVTVWWDCWGGKNWSARMRRRFGDLKHGLITTISGRTNVPSPRIAGVQLDSQPYEGQEGSRADQDIPLEPISQSQRQTGISSASFTASKISQALPAQPTPVKIAPTPTSGHGLTQRNTFSQRSLPLTTPPRTPSPTIHPTMEASERAELQHVIPIRSGIWIVILFFISFTVLLVLRGTLAPPPVELKLFANMFLAGTIIFGGGPVVIPLLREYIVTEGWVSDRDFLLGLAVIQAFPGPNFNFAVYLASLASKSTRAPAAATAILGFIGIFLPGMSLATSMVSIYPHIRKYQFVGSALRGVNAGAVGLVWTAVYRLWEIGYLVPEVSTGSSLGREPWWVVCALVSFAGNRWYDVPAPVSILVGGIMGISWWGVVTKT